MRYKMYTEKFKLFLFLFIFIVFTFFFCFTKNEKEKMWDKRKVCFINTTLNFGYLVNSEVSKDKGTLFSDSWMIRKSLCYTFIKLYQIRKHFLVFTVQVCDFQFSITIFYYLNQTIVCLLNEVGRTYSLILLLVHISLCNNFCHHCLLCIMSSDLFFLCPAS